jgi:hypothetical protein
MVLEMASELGKHLGSNSSRCQRKRSKLGWSREKQVTPPLQYEDRPPSDPILVQVD